MNACAWLARFRCAVSTMRRLISRSTRALLPVVFRWSGIKAEIFNVGNHRRKKELGAVPASFFDKENVEAREQREQLAREVRHFAFPRSVRLQRQPNPASRDHCCSCQVQDDMYSWLHAQENLAVAFFDATNTTIERRKAIIERSRREPNTYLLFVESLCDDPQVSPTSQPTRERHHQSGL